MPRSASSAAGLAEVLALPGLGERPLRLQVVVAHPDDETFGCGSLLLHAARLGAITAVCCATRGDAGEVRAGVDVPPGGVGELREAELRNAGAILGVGQIAVLGFGDSGMSGDVAPPALAGSAARDVRAAVRGAVEAFGPDVLVTLDGSDGHRDHITIRDASVAVAGELGIPVYLHCLRRELMAQWARLVAQGNPDSEYLRLGELGTPAEDITHVVDTAAYLDLREQAIAAHGSQVSPFEAMPDDLRREWLSADHLVAVAPAGTD